MPCLLSFFIFFVYNKYPKKISALKKFKNNNNMMENKILRAVKVNLTPPFPLFQSTQCNSINFLSTLSFSLPLRVYRYWVTQKLPQICTVIMRICVGKVVWFAVHICGNFWVTQYVFNDESVALIWTNTEHRTTKSYTMTSISIIFPCLTLYGLDW